MHKHFIVHRDIKPENILCDPQSCRITLIDFGFAHRHPKYNEEVKHSLIGTPAYMAPEVLLQLRANAFKADIYALGIVLYQMLFDGELPFRH